MTLHEHDTRPDGAEATPHNATEAPTWARVEEYLEHQRAAKPPVWATPEGWWPVKNALSALDKYTAMLPYGHVNLGTGGVVELIDHADFVARRPDPDTAPVPPELEAALTLPLDGWSQGQQHFHRDRKGSYRPIGSCAAIGPERFAALIADAALPVALRLRVWSDYVGCGGDGWMTDHREWALPEAERPQYGSHLLGHIDKWFDVLRACIGRSPREARVAGIKAWSKALAAFAGHFADEGLMAAYADWIEARRREGEELERQAAYLKDGSPAQLDQKMELMGKEIGEKEVDLEEAKRRSEKYKRARSREIRRTLAAGSGLPEGTADG